MSPPSARLVYELPLLIGVLNFDYMLACECKFDCAPISGQLEAAGVHALVRCWQKTPGDGRFFLTS